MRFIFQYPEVNGPDGDLLDSGSVVDVASAVERSGFHGIAFTEHPAPGARWLSAGGHQTLDPFIALANAAAVTTKIRLLTYLAVVPYRNPLMLAKTAASLDKVSNGRFVLGVGTGYLKSEFFALGVDFDERNELFDEALDVMQLHWKSEPFSYEGRHFNARDVLARPRPVQNPIPIWIGGNAKITRERVALKAQGWMPMLGSGTLHTTTRTPGLGGYEEIATKFAELKDMAGDRGKDLDLVMPYGDGSILDEKADVSKHRDALSHMESMGVTWVVLSGHKSTPEQMLATIERLGATYIAK